MSQRFAARLGLLSEGDLVVGPDPKSAASTTSSMDMSEGKSRGIGETDRGVVSRCLWPVVDGTRAN